MKKLVFAGSAVAIVTPFNEKGIHFDKLAKLISYQLDNGTDCILICGTTGEASTMPDSEHMEAISFAVKEINGRVPVMAGVGSNDTAHGIELVKKATAAGADALLNVTPYYNKTSQEGLYRHFKMMAEASDLPTILYNVPSRTNLNIAPVTYARLAQMENIVGVKECNIAHLPEVISLCGDALTYYSGEDGLVIPLMSLGGKGVISVAANILPAQVSQMTHLYLDGEHEEAAKMQIALIPVIKALFSDVNPIPIKEAMDILGWDVGPCRMPLCEMTAAGRAALAETLKSFSFPASM